MLDDSAVEQYKKEVKKVYTRKRSIDEAIEDYERAKPRKKQETFKRLADQERQRQRDELVLQLSVSLGQDVSSDMNALAETLRNRRSSARLSDAAFTLAAPPGNSDKINSFEELGRGNAFFRAVESVLADSVVVFCHKARQSVRVRSVNRVRRQRSIQRFYYDECVGAQSGGNTF